MRSSQTHSRSQENVESIAILRHGASSVYFRRMLYRGRMQTGVPFPRTSLVVRTRIQCRKIRQRGRRGPPNRMVSLEMMSSATAWTQNSATHVSPNAIR